MSSAELPSFDRYRLVKGLQGLVIVVIAVLIVGLLPDKVHALATTITIITFGLPFLIVSTLWWNGWPFKSLPRGWAGLAHTVALIILTLVGAGVAQAITGKFDLAGMFGKSGAFPIFPYGFVFGACIFVPTLQLTFGLGKMPFHKMKPIPAGFAALATVWIVGIAQYFFVMHWSGNPDGPPPPPHSGIGPVYALNWPPFLLCNVFLQLTVFILLKGYPFNRIKSDLVRFVAVMVFTVGGGILLRLIVESFGLSGDKTAGIAGTTAASVIIISILFDGWPFKDSERKIVPRLAVLAVVIVVQYLLLFALGSAGYPSGPGTPSVDLWIAGTTLNIIAPAVIIHVAVFNRWPFKIQEPAAEPAPAPQQRVDLPEAPIEVIPPLPAGTGERAAQSERSGAHGRS